MDHNNFGQVVVYPDWMVMSQVRLNIPLAYFDQTFLILKILVDSLYRDTNIGKRISLSDYSGTILRETSYPPQQEGE